MQNDSDLLANKEILCLIIEDEPPALKILVNFIEALPYLKLVAACKNAIEAIKELQHHPIDLIFLDIQLPQILGTDFIRSLPNPPKVIFTTAYRKYAVDGFDLNAVDYLLKPISFERFLKAVNKVMNIHLNSQHVNLTEGDKSKSPFSEYIIFRVDRRNIKVFLNEINCIESVKDYVKVVLDKNTFLTKMTIQSIEKILPTEHFIRVHRSFIVNISKINSFSNGVVALSDILIPVSRTYRISLLKVLEKLIPTKNE